jgi:hypothetical protein
MIQVGAHLPLMDFGGNQFGLDHLRGYVRSAIDGGLTMLAANDHLVFSVPWLDGLTALAAVVRGLRRRNAGDDRGTARGRAVNDLVGGSDRGPDTLARAAPASSRRRRYSGVGPGLRSRAVEL